MRKCRNFDDIDLEDEYWHEGNPIRFTNPEIRRMMSLAKAGKDDVFCDFGSGFGQNLIMALTERGVKKAIGLELDETRARRSRKRLEELGLHKRGKGRIVFGHFEDFNDAELKKVTILFYGLSGGDEMVARLQKVWKDSKTRRRLVWNDWHPIPEAFPDEVDYPFFLTYFPQTKKRFSARDWLERVVLQPASMIKDNVERSEGDLWKEFAHNMDVLQFRDEVAEYRKRLRKVS
jgi:precorrin-6B methylase 2